MANFYQYQTSTKNLNQEAKKSQKFSQTENKEKSSSKTSQSMTMISSSPSSRGKNINNGKVEDVNSLSQVSMKGLPKSDNQATMTQLSLKPKLNLISP